MLWELFFQVGLKVHILTPKNRVTSEHQGYGFVGSLSESADSAIKIMNTIKLYWKPIQVKEAPAHSNNQGAGANIFIENPGPEINEKMLYDTFRASWDVLQTLKIMTNPDTVTPDALSPLISLHLTLQLTPLRLSIGGTCVTAFIAVPYAVKKDSGGEHRASS
ncbi:Splicing factor 3B subunit 4 [Lemmus lemmus]